MRTHLVVALGVAVSWGCSRGTDSAPTTADGDASSVSKLDQSAGSERGQAKAPEVVLQTSLGELRVRLHPDKSPRTVRNFLGYVQNGHYDQTIFHQVQSGYVALAGSFTAELQERPGRYTITNEADNGLRNVRGTIGMARAPDDIDSAVCQFYINLADNPSLDHVGESADKFGYCVFGEVVDGLDVLDRLAAVNVHDQPDFPSAPVEMVLIESARVLR